MTTETILLEAEIAVGLLGFLVAVAGIIYSSGRLSQRIDSEADKSKRRGEELDGTQAEVSALALGMAAEREGRRYREFVIAGIVAAIGILLLRTRKRTGE